MNKQGCLATQQWQKWGTSHYTGLTKAILSLSSCTIQFDKRSGLVRRVLACLFAIQNACAIFAFSHYLWWHRCVASMATSPKLELAFDHIADKSPKAALGLPLGLCCVHKEPS